MSKEAMKLALDALEGWGKGFPDNWGDLDTKAVTALREAQASEAIEQPAQQGWKLVPREATPEMLKAMDECSKEGYDERLYAGHASSVYMAAWDASPAQPQQEPVATYHGSNDFGHDVIELEKALPIGAKLYTSPPAQRKPLTDEEIESLWDHGLYVHCSGITALRAITRAIEAKLKEKNT